MCVCFTHLLMTTILLILQQKGWPIFMTLRWYADGRVFSRALISVTQISNYPVELRSSSASLSVNDQVEVTVVSFGKGDKDVCCFKEVFGQSTDVTLYSMLRFDGKQQIYTTCPIRYIYICLYIYVFICIYINIYICRCFWHWNPVYVLPWFDWKQLMIFWRVCGGDMDPRYNTNIWNIIYDTIICLVGL